MKNFVWLLFAFFTTPAWGQDPPSPLDYFSLWPKEYLSGGLLICNEPANGTKNYDFTNWQFDAGAWLLHSQNGPCANVNAYGFLDGGCNNQATTTYYGQEVGCVNQPGRPAGCPVETDQNLVRSPDGLYLKLRDLPVPRIVTCTIPDDPQTPGNEFYTFDIVSHVSGANLNSVERFSLGSYEIVYQSFLGDYNGSDNWPAFWLWHFDEIDLIDKGKTAVIGEGYTQLANYPHSNGLCTLRMEWSPFKIEFFRNNVKYQQVYKYYYTNAAGQNLGPVDVDCGEQIPTGYVKVNPVFPETDGRFPDPGGRYMVALLSLSYDPWHCPDGLNSPANSKILIKSFNYEPTVYTNVNLNIDCNYSAFCPGSNPCHSIQSFVYNPGFLYPPGGSGGPTNFIASNWYVNNGVITSSNNTQVCLQPYPGSSFYIINASIQDVVNGTQYAFSQRFEAPDPPTATLFEHPGSQGQERYLYVELNGYCPDDVTVSATPSDAFTADSPYPEPVNGSLLYKLKPGITLRCVDLLYREPCSGQYHTSSIVYPCQQPLKGHIRQQNSGMLQELTSLVNNISYNNYILTVTYPYPDLYTYQWELVAGDGYLQPSTTSAVEGYLPNYGQQIIRVTATNDCGCSFAYHIYLQHYRSYGLTSVFPNPVSGEVTISLKGSGQLVSDRVQIADRSVEATPAIQQVRIFDPNGRMVFGQCCDQLASTQTLQVAALQPGIYCVEITDDQGRVYTDSFVKI